ncbi:MAG: M3 family metallopeptidase [Rhodoferax sp.]
MPDTAISSNPLLAFDGLPAFDQVCPEHIEPAISALLTQADAALATVTSDGFSPDWQATARVLDVATERLSRAWGLVNHLNAVCDTPMLRAAYNAMLPKVTAFYTRLGSDAKLYALYRAMAPERLNPEQAQAHRNALRNFRLGGADLQGQAKQRFMEIAERQAALSQKFSENALDATDAFGHLAQPDEVQGIPEDILAAAREAAREKGLDGYWLTLKLPCYLPVMQFARNRALRQTLYRAYVTRASDQAPEAARCFDNSAIMRELLALRQEEAHLLGFANYAELSLAPKMADSPRQVLDFLRDLARRARPWAERDVADMRAFAREHLGLDDPQAWDWPFIAEQLKQARYAFSEQEVKQYFALPKVLQGLFEIVERLFGVRIRESQAPVWAEGVRFFCIERDTACGASPELLGQFYLDPSARPGKRAGAWMDGFIDRWLRPDTGCVQTPVAHLVCNFAAGVDGKPALLTHDDVTTLFHEFGHGLHHLLTRVNERDVSGINGVEWDAVELPSQFMENFCWDWTVLQRLTAHVDSGQPLPRALFDKMLAAKNFQSGLQTLRQIEYALFDMLLHTQHQPHDDVLALLERVRDEVAVVRPPQWARMPHTFSHIFAGGYAAGYYSYQWAEVLSSDAYAAFEETALPDGRPNPETGQRFRQAILEVGASRPAMDSFIAFRGREPTLDALLRHLGMVDTA